VFLFSFSFSPWGVDMGEVVRIEEKEPRSRAEQAEQVLRFLNEKTGRNFRPTRVNLQFIEARLMEGYTMQDCKMVVAMKVREWKGTEMDMYLRPATLFNCAKFNSYAGMLA
jgi:uncharacterized phage protein (TIGR02220 family)